MRDPPPGLRGRTRPAVRASWTAGLARLTIISLAVAGFLTLSDAFGMSVVPAWVRFAYWIVMLLIGSGISLAGQRWIEHHPDAPLWPRVLGLWLTLSAVMTPVVIVATRLVFGGGWGWGTLLGFIPPVAAVSALMTGLNVLTLQARRNAAARTADAAAPGPPAPADPQPSAFMRRLPPRLRGAELYAVEAEDHYLRVHTDRGSDLLLMRLADALDELGPVEGARTHRSWWVARAAVVDARRGDGRAVLTLKDGAQAPVSRSYAPALREAGWF